MAENGANYINLVYLFTSVVNEIKYLQSEKNTATCSHKKDVYFEHEMHFVMSLTCVYEYKIQSVSL